MNLPAPSKKISITPEPLEVGLACLDQSGSGASRKAAAVRLLREALACVHTDQLPVRCLLLLATADWCNEPSASLPRDVRRECKKALGYEVPLIGGSLASLFCLAGENHFIDHGMILVAFASNDFWMTVTCIKSPHGTDEATRRQRVNRMAKDLQAKAGIRLGASAARHLLGFFPGIFLNDRREPRYLDNELHEEVLAAFGNRHRVVGGAAADSLSPTIGYQFANDKCLQSGLALAMVETDLATGVMMGHGFSTNRDIRVSVDKLKDDAETGYEVALLDGKPAGERLAELKQIGAGELGQVFLGAPSGLDYGILCVLSEEKGTEGCVRLNRRLRRGDSLYLLTTSGQEMTQTARDVCRTAVETSGAPLLRQKFMWDLTCTGRASLYQALGLNWRHVAAELKREFPGLPMVGGLCAGEFGMDKWRRAQANCFTISVNCVASSYAPRAAARVLQRKLLAAANRLSTCSTPKEVMAAALEGAIDAGATGGQVCIVDETIGLILGQDLGCAVSSPGSGHDWSMIAKLTARPIAKEGQATFPRCLLDWALPMDESQTIRIVRAIPRHEDILTLVVRSKRAIFVTNCGDQRFHCEIGAAQAGHVVTFLAIPLLGSKAKAIATLQLSFKDNSTIDRESFGHWVGFSQELAAALERAQEAEERSIAQRISNLGNVILQTPVDLTEPRYRWCTDYLKEVVHLLGVDGGHIRLLEAPPPAEAFRLVAAVGPLADLRMKTRQLMHPSQGSYNLETLQSGGIITTSREQIQALNKAVKAIENADRYGAAFSTALDTVQASAMLPLIHEKQVLGSFVIDSKQPYFFAERRCRLARSAAELGGAILRAKMDAHNRLFLEVEAEKQKLAARQRLAELQVYEDFAHQLKSPINQAQLRAQAYLTSSAEEGEKRKWSVVHGLVRRTGRATMSLRLLTELSHGRPITLKPDSVDQDTLLRKCIELADDTEHTTQEKQITFHVERETFTNSLIQRVLLDIGMFEQMLANLLDNAAKYSTRGSRVRIFVGESHTGCIYIAVANRGLLFGPGESENAKKRGWRSPNAKLIVAEGQGIGLWLVDQLMKTHGGELQIISPNRFGENEIRLAFQPS